VPRVILQHRRVGSAPHLLQIFPALTPANSSLGGRIAEYLGLASKLLMHALVTGSLYGMKVIIEAIQPLTVK
jgi:hypothetical protein